MLGLLTRIPLSLWLAAGLALTVTWGMWQRDRARDAEAALEAQEKVIAALNNYAVEVQDIQSTLRTGLEALANVPESDNCARSLGPVLDVLRQRNDP